MNRPTLPISAYTLSPDAPRFLACVALLVAVGVAGLQAFAEDWPKYNRDLANSARSSETGINSSNVTSLKSKWTLAAGNKISATPAVATINGASTVFVGSWDGVFRAVNAVTGTLIWSFTVDSVGNCKPHNCRIGSSAAVDTSANLVFFGAKNAYLYALDAVAGKLVWKQQVGDPKVGYEIWSSPAVYNSVVYVGVASQGDDPCVPGQVRAFDEHTGAKVWTFDTINQQTCPGGGQCVGAGVWSSVAIDDVNGIVYVGTGNPGLTSNPPTQNAGLYADSILALKASNGTLLNYYQGLKNDTGDEDFGSSPVLHSTSENNQCTKTSTTNYWVSDAQKNGHVFTVERNAKGLLPGNVFNNATSRYGMIATPTVRPVEVITSCGQGKKIIDDDNYLYAPGVAGSLWTFRQDGTGTIKILSQNRTSTTTLYGAPASIQDIVLFGGVDGNLYVTAQYGKTLTSFPIGAPIFGGIAISNGRLYFGDTSGIIHCMSINGQ